MHTLLTERLAVWTAALPCHLHDYVASGIPLSALCHSKSNDGRGGEEGRKCDGGFVIWGGGAGGTGGQKRGAKGGEGKGGFKKGG